MAGRNEKRQYLGLAKSPTEVTFPDFEIMAEDIDLQQGTANLERTADGTRRPGWNGAAGVENISLNFKFEQVYLDTSTGSQSPHNAACYDLCFSDATGTTTRSRKVADYAFNDVDGILVKLDTTGAAGTKYTLGDMKGNLKVEYPLNDRVTWTAEALAATYAEADHSDAIPALVYYDTNSETRMPVVNKNATLVLSTDATSPVVYSGHFFSGEVDLAMEPVAVEAASGSNGVGEITLNPQGHAKGKIVVEQEDIAGAFNPRTYQNTSTNVYVTITWTEPGGSDTVTHLFYAQITKVTNTAVNKRLAWELDLDLVYPETSTNHDSGQTTTFPVFEIQYN